MSLTFEMQSARDCLEDYKRKLVQIESDDLNTSVAMDCAVAGWSIADWIFNCDGRRLGYANLQYLQNALREQCRSLAYIQDIAIGRKHKDVTYYVPTVKSTGTHNGAFSHGFSSGFDISRLVFETEDGEFHLGDTLQNVLSFYETYFEQNEIC